MLTSSPQAAWTEVFLIITGIQSLVTFLENSWVANTKL